MSKNMNNEEDFEKLKQITIIHLINNYESFESQNSRFSSLNLSEFVELTTAVWDQKNFILNNLNNHNFLDSHSKCNFL